MLLGMQFLSLSCEPASENTEPIRTLVTLCPNLRRIDWYIGNQLDMSLAVIIERNVSHGTWSLRRMDRETNRRWCLFALGCKGSRKLRIVTTVMSVGIKVTGGLPSYLILSLTKIQFHKCCVGEVCYPLFSQ
jgi:hypothetical protein